MSNPLEERKSTSDTIVEQHDFFEWLAVVESEKAELERYGLNLPLQVSIDVGKQILSIIRRAEDEIAQKVQLICNKGLYDKYPTKNEMVIAQAESYSPGLWRTVYDREKKEYYDSHDDITYDANGDELWSYDQLWEEDRIFDDDPPEDYYEGDSLPNEAFTEDEIAAGIPDLVR